MFVVIGFFLCLLLCLVTCCLSLLMTFLCVTYIRPFHEDKGYVQINICNWIPLDNVYIVKRYDVKKLENIHDLSLGL